MSLLDVSFRNPLDPEDWYGWCLELTLGGAPLVALPPTLTIASDLGRADPAEYDHPPFEDTWYRLGDSVPRERPLLVLAGTHTYRSDTEALDHVALIERAVAVADALYWRGQFLVALNTAFPQTVQTRTGDRFVDTTFTLTLNTAQRLTRALIAEVQR